MEETFPASDAPANTVVTGTNPAPAFNSDAARAGGVTDNVAASRLEMRFDGEVAVLNYERGEDTFVSLAHRSASGSSRSSYRRVTRQGGARGGRT